MGVAAGFLLVGALVLAVAALGSKAAAAVSGTQAAVASSPAATAPGSGAPSGLTGGGLKLLGKTSWFGGPNDPSAGSTTASGAPTSQPGIAVYNQQTLGGWWAVTFPNGRTVQLQQTDIGPAPWTNRLLDVTYSALSLAGYTEQNFPTDGQISAVYLGKK